MTPHPRKCGRAQTLAKLRDIAESWRDDSDPLKQWVAQRFAAVVTADDTFPDTRRHTAVLRALGLFGRLDAPQARIRAAIDGIESPPARRDAVRLALRGLRDLDDATIDRRIRAALT